MAGRRQAEGASTYQQLLPGWKTTMPGENCRRGPRFEHARPPWPHGSIVHIRNRTVVPQAPELWCHILCPQNVLGRLRFGIVVGSSPCGGAGLVSPCPHLNVRCHACMLPSLWRSSGWCPSPHNQLQRETCLCEAESPSTPRSPALFRSTVLHSPLHSSTAAGRPLVHDATQDIALCSACPVGVFECHGRHGAPGALHVSKYGQLIAACAALQLQPVRCPDVHGQPGGLQLDTHSRQVCALLATAHHSDCLPCICVCVFARARGS